MNQGVERRTLKRSPLRRAFDDSRRALVLAERRLNDPRPMTMIERQQIAILAREALTSLNEVRGTL